MRGTLWCDQYYKFPLHIFPPLYIGWRLEYVCMSVSHWPFVPTKENPQHRIRPLPQGFMMKICLCLLLQFSTFYLGVQATCRVTFSIYPGFEGFIDSVRKQMLLDCPVGVQCREFMSDILILDYFSI